ncbi:proline-rich receptor-like protein kinase PERK8 [Nylanderia fulva]|uniref:proline-rich receptor-like protein kinase PERK8 n=1 Tax=Nylanderia fulva TaxID=613905 RepID=UPI0010FBA676|nr:proline-rich receptor-like protein kinase PERK8 [Nylanderia fulva]
MGSTKADQCQGDQPSDSGRDNPSVSGRNNPSVSGRTDRPVPRVGTYIQRSDVEQRSRKMAFLATPPPPPSHRRRPPVLSDSPASAVITIAAATKPTTTPTDARRPARPPSRPTHRSTHHATARQPAPSTAGLTATVRRPMPPGAGGQPALSTAGRPATKSRQPPTGTPRSAPSDAREADNPTVEPTTISPSSHGDGRRSDAACRSTTRPPAPSTAVPPTIAQRPAPPTAVGQPHPVQVTLGNGRTVDVPFYAATISRRYKVRTPDGRWIIRFNRRGQPRMIRQLPHPP